eukprot:scaffold18466_cov62-Phaeocystis_antarctica.AAC.1
MRRRRRQERHEGREPRGWLRGLRGGAASRPHDPRGRAHRRRRASSLRGCPGRAPPPRRESRAAAALVPRARIAAAAVAAAGRRRAATPRRSRPPRAVRRRCVSGWLSRAWSACATPSAGGSPQMAWGCHPLAACLPRRRVAIRHRLKRDAEDGGALGPRAGRIISFVTHPLADRAVLAARRRRHPRRVALTLLSVGRGCRHVVVSTLCGRQHGDVVRVSIRVQSA